MRSRKLRYILLIIPLAAVVVLLAWVLTTSAGMMFVINSATTFAGISLQSENLRGTLASRVTADRITYQDKSTEVTLDQLDTALSLFWLLDARLAFDETKIDKLKISLKDKKEPQSDQTDVKLPIGISFSSLSIKHIAIENKKPIIEINNVSADDIELKKQIEFDKLQFTIANSNITLDGSMGFAKTSDIDVNATWNISATENTPAVSGNSSITGNFEKLAIETELAKPQNAFLKSQIEDVFTDLKWRTTLSSELIDLGLVNANLQSKLQNVKTELSGNLMSVEIQGTAAIADPQYGHWDSRFNARLAEEQWQISELLLTAPETNKQIQIQAHSAGSEPYTLKSAVELSFSWQQLQWPLTGKASYFSEKGKTQITGSLDNFRITASGNFSFDDYHFNDIEAEGKGTNTTLLLDSFAATYLDGSWNGNVSLDWTQGFNWQAALKVKAANPSLQWESLAGKIDGNVTGKGRHQGDDWIITGDIKNVTGTFHNYPVNGSSHYSVSAKEYAFTNLNLRSGANSLQGAIAISDYLGDADTQIKATWKLNAKNIKQLLAEASGHINSSGEASGSLKAPLIDAKANIENLQYKGYAFSKADLDANVNLEKNDKLLVKLDAKDSNINGTVISQLLLSVTGSTYSHEVSVNTTVTDGYAAKLRAKGGYKNGQWDGKLTTLNIDTSKYGNWKLTQSFPLQISDNRIFVKNACTTQDASQSLLCFDVDSHDYTNIKVDSNISKLPLNLAQNFLSERITSITGTVRGKGHLLIDNQVIKELTLNLENDGGELTHTLVNDMPRTIQFKNLSIKAENIRQAIVISSHLDLHETANANAYLKLDNIKVTSDINEKTPIIGDVKIELNDLSLVPVFFPDIQSIEGKTSSHFSISGTLGSPQLTGEGKFFANRITLPLIGLELKNTELHTRSTASRKIIIEGKTQSGDGNINVKGEIPDYASDRLLMKLEIDGKNFLAVKIPDVEMEISPKLTLILDGNTVNMDGEILVDTAHISPLETYSGLTPSSDVVFIDPKSQKEQQEPFKLLGSIRLKLSERVYVQGAGFVGRIAGELLITESGSDITLATGELLIKDGRYTASVKGDNIPSLLVSIAQKELLIDDSKLIFASTPIDNPRLDIRARRPTGTDIVAGVEIKGHANNPQITLFSEPSMDQADILAYLTLGYPLNEASKKDGQYLARIASSIGLVGGEKIAKGIAKEFGIDEVYIQSEDTTQQASLVLGKYLSPKLYVRYAVGIGEAVDTLQIQYKLTDKLMLRTETAESQTGTDIIYTIEKE